MYVPLAMMIYGIVVLRSSFIFLAKLETPARLLYTNWTALDWLELVIIISVEFLVCSSSSIIMSMGAMYEKCTYTNCYITMIHIVRILINRP